MNKQRPPAGQVHHREQDYLDSMPESLQTSDRRRGGLQYRRGNLMTVYQKLLAKRAPELNALHMESLAYSDLNGMPDDIATLARKMGPAKLAKLHGGLT